MINFQISLLFSHKGSDKKFFRMCIRKDLTLRYISIHTSIGQDTIYSVLSYILQYSIYFKNRPTYHPTLFVSVGISGCLDCLPFCSALMCYVELCNVWYYLQVQKAPCAPALTGQRSFFCCQMLPGTVFLQEDFQHCLPWTEAESSMGLPEGTAKKFDHSSLL